MNLLSGSLMACPFRAWAGVGSGKPVNILVRLADDWRRNIFGVAGNPGVKTPVLDRMANEGTRFTRGLCTTLICGVSRDSLFTGQWMSNSPERPDGSLSLQLSSHSRPDDPDLLS